jgi:hypothetical protein
LESPRYVAVIELVPTGNAVVGKFAAPLTSVALPRNVVVLLKRLKNWTVPVGKVELEFEGVTVAVNMTIWPDTGKVGANVTVVVVDDWATVTVVAGETGLSA